jgi:phosphatidylserine/phosphatidylglycerophosphate/cardiolipin synthase-like enzyme
MKVSTCFDRPAWFDPDRSSDVLFGGTELLKVFLDALYAAPGGSISLLSPFASIQLFAKSEISGWARLDHQRFSLTLVTQSVPDAGRLESALGRWPWRRLRVHAYSRLHGKMHLLEDTTGSFLGIVGSHNLTTSALERNLEFGVLIRGTTRSPLFPVFRRCERIAARTADAAMANRRAVSNPNPRRTDI